MLIDPFYQYMWHRIVMPPVKANRVEEALCFFYYHDGRSLKAIAVSDPKEAPELDLKKVYIITENEKIPPGTIMRVVAEKDGNYWLEQAKK